MNFSPSKMPYKKLRLLPPKCDICQKKNCEDTHSEIVSYIVYEKEGATLSTGGIKKFGAAYLEELREKR